MRVGPPAGRDPGGQDPGGAAGSRRAGYRRAGPRMQDLGGARPPTGRNRLAGPQRADLGVSFLWDTIDKKNIHSYYRFWAQIYNIKCISSVLTRNLRTN